MWRFEIPAIRITIPSRHIRCSNFVIQHMSTPHTSAEVAPEQELQAMVNDVYARCLPIDVGEVATYIPELSKANPDDFGVCVATSDGRLFEAGTCDRPFTIQSISKPFTFGMALEELGHDKVFQHVGVESQAATRSCRDLAMMAATLSNMGCHPITGRSTFTVRYVKDILSIMFTCGMYDYSGHWAYRVGVPAKSGVGGGVIAVVNRQLGISTYSPRLDRYGNSCRSTAVCVELASQLGLHVFDCLNVGSRFLDAIL